MAESTRKYTSSMKVPAFAEYEFSDDEDDILFTSHGMKSKEENCNSKQNIGSKRLVLSEENYKKNPVVYNIPIRVQHTKSRPPPLVDVKSAKLIGSTCIPPIYPIVKSKALCNGVDKSETENEFKKSFEENYQMMDKRKHRKNDSSCRFEPKYRNSLLSRTQNLNGREAYHKFLTTIVPYLYKPDSKENKNKFETTWKNREVTGVDDFNRKISKPKIEAVIDLAGDDEDQPDEVIDLSDDDLQFTSYEKSGKSQSLSNSQPKLPQVEPVNTLKQQLDMRPNLKSEWLKDFSEKYQQKDIERKRQILEETNNLKQLSLETAKHEKFVQDRFRNLKIDTETICLEESEEEEEEVEFPEFSRQDIDLIKKACRGPDRELLISKFNLNISRYDIKTLIDTCWLNDEVINFYMNLLMERGEKRQNEGYPKVYAMNTFFLPQLLKQGYSGVRRWTRKVDIFAYDIIPIPVHVGEVHWCMAIIHLRNNTIKYYDSMGTSNPRVLNALEQYLKEESLDKKKKAFDTSRLSKECVQNIPRQMNGSDCGVFSCMFAEYITRNKNITFTQQHMPYFRQKMILEIVRGELLL